jgi:lipopolysaccharide heptosyltransferase II
MHILAIRFSSLGDVLLQSSMLSWLKQQYPQSKITLLTASEFTSLLDGHPHVDQVIGMERFKGLAGIWQLRSFIKELNKKSPFDLILDLHGTTRSFFIKLFMPFTKKISMDKRRLERSLLVKAKLDLLSNTESIHSRNMVDFSNVLAPGYDQDDFESFLNETAKTSRPLSLTSSPQSFIADESPLEQPYIVLSPVASFAPKRWPINYFANLAELILEDKSLSQYKVVVLAGPADDYCQQLNYLKDKYAERFYNLQGKTSLKESMKYLKHCDLCIGNDTGLNHIAESCGNPVVTIFGPTSESFGFRAHLPTSKNICAQVSCSPCSTTGKKPCSLNEQLCMLRITPQYVWQQASEILGAK